jgi:hypothetical protein
MCSTMLAAKPVISTTSAQLINNFSTIRLMADVLGEHGDL